MRTRVPSLALLSGLRILRCCELQCRWQTRLGSGVAVAPIRPLAWEPPYATGTALKKATTTTKRKVHFLVLILCLILLTFLCTSKLLVCTLLFKPKVVLFFDYLTLMRIALGFLLLFPIVNLTFLP